MRHPAVAVGLLVCLLTPPAFALNLTWDAGGGPSLDGVFSTPANWNPDQVPGVGDAAYFSEAGTYTVTFDSNQSSDSAWHNNGAVTWLSDSSTARNYNLIDLAVGGGEPLTIGASGNAVKATATGEIRIGTLSTTTDGTVVVSGFGSELNATLGTATHYLGRDAAFTATLRYELDAEGTIAGTIDVGNGSTDTATGILEVLSGAYLSAGHLNVATSTSDATGTITVSGLGSTVVQLGASNLSVGSTSGGAGSLNVNDSALFDIGTGSVAIHATGTVNVATSGLVRGNGVAGSNGTLAIPPSAGGVGKSLTSTGTLTFSDGGVLSLNGGNGGSSVPGGALGGNGGTLSIAGGTASLSTTARVELRGGNAGVGAIASAGSDGGNGGLVQITGGTTNLNPRTTFDLRGGRGGDVSVNEPAVGGNGGSGGMVQLSGGIVNLDGGTIRLDGGAPGTTSQANLGMAGAVGSVDISGGTFNFSAGEITDGSLTIPSTPAALLGATTNVSGGTLRLLNDFSNIFGTINATSAGIVDLSGAAGTNSASDGVPGGPGADAHQLNSSGTLAFGGDSELKLIGGAGGNANFGNGGAAGNGGIATITAGTVSFTGSASADLSGGRGGTTESFYSNGRGGDGGSLDVTGGAISFADMATFSANGGQGGSRSPGSPGTSGNGGSIAISGASTSLTVSGSATLQVQGAAGVSSAGTNKAGGQGGTVTLSGGATQLLGTSKVTAAGGVGGNSGSGTAGAGGQGGSAEMSGAGTSLLITDQAILDLRGAAGTTAVSSISNGGLGGSFGLFEGDLEVSGSASILAAGGNGATGGSFTQMGGTATFSSMATFDAAGGNALSPNGGSRVGGSGGTVELSAGTSTLTDSAALNLRGGNGAQASSSSSLGNGGSGGNVTFSGSTVLVQQSSSIRLSGGQGASGGTAAGATGGAGGVLQVTAGTVTVGDAVIVEAFGGTGGGASSNFRGGHGGAGGQLRLSGGNLQTSGASHFNFAGTSGTMSGSGAGGSGGNGGSLLVEGSIHTFAGSTLISMYGGNGAKGTGFAGAGGAGGSGTSLDVNGGTLRLRDDIVIDLYGGRGGGGSSSGNPGGAGGAGGNGGNVNVNGGTLDMRGGTINLAGGAGGAGGGSFNSGPAGANGTAGEVNVDAGTFTFSAGTITTDPSITSSFPVLLAKTTLNVTGGLMNFDDAADLQQATVNLTGGRTTAGAIRRGDSDFNFLGGELGFNIFQGDLVNGGGDLIPGTQIGTKTITGNYTQEAGSLEARFTGSSGQSDRVQINGVAALGGNLEVRPFGPLAISPAGSWTILTASVLTGTFDNVGDGGRLAAGGGSVRVDYNYVNDTVRLSNFLLGTFLAGDYNDDGRVDAADYTVWRDNLGAPAGTLPNDSAGGTIGTLHYQHWKDNFGNVEVNSALESARVPEPSTLALGELAVLMLARRRVRRTNRLAP